MHSNDYRLHALLVRERHEQLRRIAGESRLRRDIGRQRRRQR